MTALLADERSTDIPSGWRSDLILVVGLALIGILLRFIGWRLLRGEGDLGAYVTAFCVWDCAWYTTIVETGYDPIPGMRLVPGAANWAFFPFYPALVGLIRAVTGFSGQGHCLRAVEPAWRSPPSSPAVPCSVPAGIGRGGSSPSF